MRLFHYFWHADSHIKNLLWLIIPCPRKGGDIAEVTWPPRSYSKDHCTCRGISVDLHSLRFINILKEAFCRHWLLLTMRAYNLDIVLFWLRDQLLCPFQLILDKVSCTRHADVVLTSGAFQCFVVVPETYWAKILVYCSVLFVCRSLIHALHLL